MERRALIATLAGGLFAASLAAEAQQMDRVWRVGLLNAAPSRLIEEFRQGLRELGYVEGRNLLIDHRTADGTADRLSELAADLVRLKPDVIVAVASPAAQAAHVATKTIPLVFVNVGDPIGLGLAASLARPGGNATGMASYGPELLQKVLEVAKDLRPKTKHIAIVWNPGNPLHARGLKNLEAPAGQLAIHLRALKVATPDELEPAFRTAAAGRADLVWVFGDPLFFAERTRIAAYALGARLPSMFNRSVSRPSVARELGRHVPAPLRGRIRKGVAGGRRRGGRARSDHHGNVCRLQWWSREDPALSPIDQPL